MAPAKPHGGWRYEHLFELPEEKRYEIIDGELYEMSAPTWFHQVLVTSPTLLFSPFAAARRGQLIPFPVDLFVAGGRPVQPDLLYLPPAWTGKLTKMGVEGVPTLIVELLSPSNREYDLVRKRRLYERAGAPGYWIVDPEMRSIEAPLLRGGVYEIALRAEGEGALRSAVFPELRASLTEVFADMDRHREMYGEE